MKDTMYSLEKLGAVRDWIDIPDRTTRAYALSASVIQEILGLDWFTKNLGTNATEPFFHMNKIEQDPETTIDRGIAVGEMLFNLQGCRRSHSPEGPFCEFEVGKLMFLMGYAFRFVKATGTKTNDYDMDLLLSSDAYVPIESKCKVEATNQHLLAPDTPVEARTHKYMSPSNSSISSSLSSGEYLAVASQDDLNWTA